MDVFRYFILVFILSKLLLSLSLEWVGFIPTQDAEIFLNNGDNQTIILKRDPNVNQSQANDFGSRGATNLNYSSSGISTLTLIRDNVINSMVFYHRKGNYINVNQGGNLVIDLKNTGTNGRFYLYGGEVVANNGGNIKLSGVYIVTIGDASGGLIQVNSGGKIEFSNIGFIKSVSRTSRASVVNNGGELIVKSNFYNSGFTERVNGYLFADSAGFFEHRSGNTTIEGLFYNLVLIIWK